MQLPPDLPTRRFFQSKGLQMDPSRVSHSVRAAAPTLVVTEECSDGLLMERIREGQRPAYSLLLERYWSRLNVYAVSIIEDQDGAQDVVQDVFIQVWQKRAEWSPSGTVCAYLYRITRNLALNARRDQRLRRERQGQRGEARVRDRAPRTPDQQMEANALRAEVDAAIARLSDRRGEVFRLSRFHGLSYKEIAEMLGSSPQTVANQMSAALAELRHALSHLIGE
ncbi:MAG: RNA polymerase sigma-70 factor [Gemmatimonadales bacterium]|nr:MAG: RNA polymerase sigma-70 factor [Gemmatimonadales bacterium]